MPRRRFGARSDPGRITGRREIASIRMTDHDVVLTGGRVIDPAAGIDARRDVAIVGGRLAGIDDDGDPSEARRVVDVSGYLVVPGLVDVHAHVYQHGARNGLDPDLAGVRSGVTTVVDAGSAGSATYEGFHHHVVRRAVTEVLAYVHIARHGLSHVPEAHVLEDMDVDGTVETLARHPEAVGVKVRACGPVVEHHGLDAIDRARRAARQAGVPLMVHVGDANFGRSGAITADLLPLLEAGDVITHVFTGAPGRLLDDSGRVLDALREARERGVWLDAAHGRYNLDFAVAEQMAEQGIVPDTVSTDITKPGRSGPVGSLPHTMGKFLALGFDLGDVIAMTTHNPARMLGRSDLGTLAPGAAADVTVLELVTGRWWFTDGSGARIEGDVALRPVVTFKNGVQHAPDYGPFPRGWLPPEAG
jgi:dihydroorotase